MIEPTVAKTTGRSARWGAALLLLPSSAAVFGGAVWWASATTPRSPLPVPAPAQVAAAPQIDPQVIAARAALERKIAAHRQDSAKLARRLAKLRAQIARTERAAHKTVSGDGTTTVAQTNGGGGSVQPSAGGQGSGYQAPAPVVVAPPPPPPPPVNTTTGASGKP